jgi:hypothetical protein
MIDQTQLVTYSAGKNSLMTTGPSGKGDQEVALIHQLSRTSGENTAISVFLQKQAASLLQLIPSTGDTENESYKILKENRDIIKEIEQLLSRF